MSLFYPTKFFHRIYDIPPELLESWGITTLVLDVDNTLTTHDNPVPDEKVLHWLDEMEALGMKRIILSNNYPERVEPFARRLGLGYTARAWKPSTKGFKEISRKLDASGREMLVIGDQIFTDILGGNLFGARTVLVEPMEPEHGIGFRVKRLLEKGILKGYQKRGKEK